MNSQYIPPCREDTTFYIWEIWGIDLDSIYLRAKNFDDAIAEARKINPEYDTGKALCVALF